MRVLPYNAATVQVLEEFLVHVMSVLPFAMKLWTTVPTWSAGTSLMIEVGIVAHPPPSRGRNVQVPQSVLSSFGVLTAEDQVGSDRA